MISNNESNIQSTTRHKNWDHILTLIGNSNSRIFYFRYYICGSHAGKCFI
uniref:Uncharacterized protein n=1 Tax=Candidatus Kentrum sp. LPFa TaxID=2126335 RepID=A0A450WQY2_9GAMM|nr:MAG: hypothetical protein BECKLPF1236B_GA0070989_11737 [Candidatus Kentron sp. LPFa]